MNEVMGVISDGEPYNFRGKSSDGQSIVHAINLLLSGDVVGAEVGVSKAHTTCALLQSCPNIKLLYAVDSYKPYVDRLRIISDGTPCYFVDTKESELTRFVAHHNVRFSGAQERVKWCEADSDAVALTIPDGSLDFVFLDAHLSAAHIENDLAVWVPKVRAGGLVCGHDWDSLDVQLAVVTYRDAHDMRNTLSYHDNTFVWVK